MRLREIDPQLPEAFRRVKAGLHLGKGLTARFRRFVRPFLLHERDCPLCAMPFSEGESDSTYPVWDHCWKCGGFRGFVCSTCNRKIPGYWKRQIPPSLKAQIESYLKAHDCSHPFLPSGKRLK